MMKEAFQFMYDSSIITIMMIMMTIIVLLVLLLPLLRTLSLMCNLISYLSPIVALGRDEAQSDRQLQETLLFVTFLDLTKAFDTVNRDALW